MGEFNDAQYGYRGKLGLIVVGPNRRSGIDDPLFLLPEGRKGDD